MGPRCSSSKEKQRGLHTRRCPFQKDLMLWPELAVQVALRGERAKATQNSGSGRRGVAVWGESQNTARVSLVTRAHALLRREETRNHVFIARLILNRAEQREGGEKRSPPPHGAAPHGAASSPSPRTHARASVPLLGCTRARHTRARHTNTPAAARGERGLGGRAPLRARAGAALLNLVRRRRQGPGARQRAPDQQRVRHGALMELVGSPRRRQAPQRARQRETPLAAASTFSARLWASAL